MHGLKLDGKDFDILAALRDNAKQSVFQLAKRLHLPPTTVHNRVKKLKDNKVIQRYTVRLDRAKLGQEVCALVFLYLDNASLEPGSKKGGLAERLMKYPAVDAVFETTGSIDVIVKVYGKKVQDITEFVVNHIREIRGVARTETVITLSVREK